MTISRLELLEKVSTDPESVVGFFLVSGVRLHADFGPGSNPALVYLTRTPERIDRSWFASRTVVKTVIGEVRPPWLDLSVHLAGGLGVAPGDQVSGSIQGREVEFVVRRILAIGRRGIPYVAVGPMLDGKGVSLLRTPGKDPLVASSALLATDISPTDLERELFGSGEGAARWRSEILSDLRRTSRSTPVLVSVLTVLGYGVVIGLAFREAVALVDERRLNFLITSVLGVSRSKLALAACLVEGPPVVAGIALAYLAVTRVAYDGLISAVLPPVLLPGLNLAFIGAAVAYLIGMFLVTRWQLGAGKMHGALMKARGVR